MTFEVVIGICAVAFVWLLIGLYLTRMVIIVFEEEYGRGCFSPTDSGILFFTLLGPFTLVSLMVLDVLYDLSGRGLVKKSLGRMVFDAPKKLGGRRTPVRELFLWGVAER